MTRLVAGAPRNAACRAINRRKLLCTGDLEEVRALRGTGGGSFPPANAAGAYTPASEGAARRASAARRGRRLRLLLWLTSRQSQAVSKLDASSDTGSASPHCR